MAKTTNDDRRAHAADDRLPSGRKDPFAGSTVADRSGTRAPVARHLPGDVKVHTEAGPSVSAGRVEAGPSVSEGRVDTGGRVETGRVDTPYDERLVAGGERRGGRGPLGDARAEWHGEERRLEQADPRFWLGNDRRRNPFAYGKP